MAKRPTAALYLVRHAEAGDRTRYVGDDLSRPLTEDGHEQAKEIAARLGSLPLARLVTSPARRCVETLDPLAEASGLALENLHQLVEGADPDDALATLLALTPMVTSRVVACSHGDVLTGIVATLLAQGAEADGKTKLPSKLPSTRRASRRTCTSSVRDRVGGSRALVACRPMDGDTTRGALLLVGGEEWQGPGTLERELLGRAGGEVVLLPTAAAYERPTQHVERAAAFLGALGGSVRPLMVLSRRDAEDPINAEVVGNARFVYLSGGSPLHLRSVLKDSAVLDALVGAWRRGAIVAGSSAGAMALSDPMVDPRGGAFTVGLGLVRNLAVVAHGDGEVTPQLRRTLSLSPSGCALIALGADSALVREPDGTWRSVGARVDVYTEGRPGGLESLAGKPVA
jgi:cyanophycinase